MRTLLLLMLTALITTSCVSRKKYDALQAEVDRLKGVESTLDAYTKNQDATANMLRDNEERHKNEVEELHKLIAMQKKQMEMAGTPPPTPEQQMAIEEQNRRDHEMRMAQAMQGGPGQAVDDKITQLESSMRLTEQSLKGALSSYDESKVHIERVGKYLIVSAKDELLYNSNRNEISASGQTFINRFSPTMKVANGLTISIVGITDQNKAEELNKASVKSNALFLALNSNSDFKKLKPIASTHFCDSALSGRKSQCDRTEIIFDYDNDALVDTMRVIK